MLSLSSNTLDSLEKILDVADKKLAEGRLDSAISYYSLVISNFKGQYYAYECHIRRAEAYRLSKQFSLALDDCDFILHAYSNPVSALRIKGRVLFDEKRYQEATRVFNLVLANCYDEESLFYREFAEELAVWSGSEPLNESQLYPRKTQISQTAQSGTNPRYSSAVATHLATYFPTKATMYEPVLSTTHESPLSSPNLSESTATLSDLSDGSESPVLSDTTLDGFDSNLSELNYQAGLKEESMLKQRWSSIFNSKIDAIKSNLGLNHHPKKVSFQV